MKSEKLMTWMSVDAMAASVALPEGYRFERLARQDIPDLIAFVTTWFPGITVGSASCYTREAFYESQTTLAGESETDVLVIVVKHGENIAAVICGERNREALTLYASLAIVAGEHRGAQLGKTGVVLMELLARHMNFGLIYGMATLKAPYMQSALEEAGWQLIGITPGYDLELIAPGVVKRVFEAVYAKVLVTEGNLLLPDRRNLTAKTRAFFDFLFSGAGESVMSDPESA
ncbi:MAG: hypothetical protein ACJ8OJ_04045 [Povalibacter sp.]